MSGLRQYPALYSFNRGIVSPLGLARSDQKRVGLSAQIMDNWIPRVLGSMSLRPGLGYLGTTASNAAARFLPFVFATNDTALIEFTNVMMRVWIQDALLTRAAVSSAVTNGTFSGSVTGWTDGSDAGGSISWQSGNYLAIVGNGTARGIGYQAVTVAGADQTTEHGLRIVVARGPVTFQVGTSNSTDDLVSQTTLETGSHSIAFTPNSATFYIQFQTTQLYKALVQSVAVEASGVVALVSPFAAADLGNLRHEQSGDTVFLACAGQQQRKVERRGTRPNARSWSIVNYHTDDGPFLIENFTPTTLAAAAVTGDTAITSSRALFKPTHVGAIFSLTSSSAQQTVVVTAQNTFTSPSIKVTGVGPERDLAVTITGTWSATVTLQQSIGVDGSWSDFASYTTNQDSLPVNDGLDNQTVYYRIGVKTGGYTSGTATCQISYGAGNQTGIVRVTSYQSSTVVSVQVLSALGGTTATQVWAEGYWSDRQGWPTAVELHEGRLWWAGKNGVFGSVSDSFYSYDQTTVGDSGPIIRTIGSGPVDTINWIMSLQRMILGAQGAEFSVKSSALDSPLTPTDFTIKPTSTQGSGAVDTARIDTRSVFVDRTGIKVYEIAFDLQSYDYSSSDLTAIVPELGNNNGTAGVNIVRLAVQRKPDTRIHCVRSDGVVMLAVTDRVEDVLSWQTISTNGTIEDAVVLPAATGSTEDQVYYVVNRTINGSTVRYLEKWAKETECRGATLNKQADAYITFTNGSPSTAVTGLSHLIGSSVVVWQDGVCPVASDGSSVATYTVDGTGSITLSTAATTGIVGLAYTGQWQSAKLGMQQSAVATTLVQQKRMSHLGIVGAWIHPKGLKHGSDFDHMDDMPAVEDGVAISTDTIRTTYDEQEFIFPGQWLTDMRLCLLATAPRPVTLLAAIVDYEIHH